MIPRSVKEKLHNNSHHAVQTQTQISLTILKDAAHAEIFIFVLKFQGIT